MTLKFWKSHGWKIGYSEVQSAGLRQEMAPEDEEEEEQSAARKSVECTGVRIEVLLTVEALTMF